MTMTKVVMVVEGVWPGSRDMEGKLWKDRLDSNFVNTCDSSACSLDLMGQVGVFSHLHRKL